jgi:hypothetical protein
MSTSRAVRSALAVVLVCALCAIGALVHPANAGSISSANAGSVGPTAGTSEVAGTVSTRMVINRFRAVGRKVVGRGTVISTFRNAAGVKSVKRKHFWIRIREARLQQQQQQQELCHILFLELGEVDLTLAGLHAILRAADPSQPIQLRLQADRTHGILGRLFCDLAEAGGTVATPAKAQRAARTLTRRLKAHTIMRVRATIYAPSHRMGATARASSPQGVQQEAECEVLHLVLGPVHLDLLGLVVDLNKIILDLKAIPGTLLGNIFCQLVTPPPPPPAPAGP